jgi:spermidine synthase
MYEIGWIRMLSLVLGSSTHAFELMLSAFILGIAFGGLWVRRRIDAAGDTVRLLGWVQVAMGIAAIATLPIYGSSFVWMQKALAALSFTDGGYIAFNLVSHAICLAVMFPAAFFAGMTLPLITASLLRTGAGERAIGQVYAANTAGAIAGVVFAVHLGLPLLGLKNLIVFAAAIDMALGLILLKGAAVPRLRRLDFGAAGALSLAAVAVALLAVKLNAHEMASGVFRLGHLLQDPQEVHLHVDGKTSTVSVTQSGSVLALRVNGKPDGALGLGGAPVADEITMTLFGALPQLIAPQARQMAVIGFGTGISTHVLLASRSLERLDTVEIEPAVTQAAERHFLQFNRRAFQDPRSRIHYEDAKTYFSASALRYDAIASEPSNPWVSGVASLFTTEFYRDARRYLTEGGLFYQWVQLYEISPQLLATVIAALEENFSDYELWMANQGDLIIVAANGGQVPRIDARAFDNPTLRKELERFHINGVDDLYLHRAGDRRSLGPYFASRGAQANSDFFPVLDQNAARARFLRANVTDFASLQEAPLRLVELFDGQAERHPRTARLTAGERPWLPVAALVHQAAAVSEYMRAGRPDLLRKLPTALAPKLVTLRMALVECRAGLPSGSLRGPLADLAYVTAHLPAQESVALWSVLAQSPCRGISESEQRWLRVHAAVAAASAADMRQSADLVLREQPDLDGGLLAHAVAVYMSGAILEGDAGAALRTFGRYRKAMGAAAREWEPVFRFLIAQADRPRAPR